MQILTIYFKKLNLKVNPTIKDLQILIKDYDDEKFNHIIWVSKDGDVFVEKFATNNPSSKFEQSVSNDLKFWLGVFHRGNGYVGEQAAKDENYLKDLYKNLIDNWENDFQGHIEN